MTSLVSKLRLAALTKLRCEIFQTTYNPTSYRTGAKYLRRRLRGPSMLGYYPPEFNFAKILRTHKELEMIDEDEEERLVDVAERRKRGKGPPKKAKDKCTSSPRAKSRSGHYTLLTRPCLCVTSGEQTSSQEAVIRFFFTICQTDGGENRSLFTGPVPRYRRLYFLEHRKAHLFCEYSLPGTGQSVYRETQIVSRLTLEALT